MNPDGKHPNISPLEASLQKLSKWQASTQYDIEAHSFHPGWEHPHPIHTVYGGAHLFKPKTIWKLSQIARDIFLEQCPTATKFRDAFRLTNSRAGSEYGHFRVDSSQAGAIFPLVILDRVYELIRNKLAKQPIEDYRIDFEDGLGIRTDAEEDRLTIQAAAAFSEACKEGTLAPLMGIRIKSFSHANVTHRARRTLELFFKTAVNGNPATFPSTFIVTLPKVKNRLQVQAFIEILKDLKDRYGLEHCQIYGEIMIESAEAFTTGARGLRELVSHDQGLILGVHFGAHDYLASLNSAGVHPNLRHPLCDHARMLLKTSLADLPVALVDGAETFLPIGSPDVIHHAWQLSFANVWHALDQGIYQGWDLHPAQIPARLAAVMTYFQTGLPSATARLKNFVEGLTQAARVGAHFDDLATAQGLLNFFDRALQCGAITPDELRELSIDFGEIKSQIRIIPKLSDVAPKAHKDLWPERDN